MDVASAGSARRSSRAGRATDHRPDLKQLLFILTTSSDGGVPVQFRCGDGNQSDSTTHQATWETLRNLTGDSAFLFVADSACQEALLNPAVMKGHRRAFVAANA